MGEAEFEERINVAVWHINRQCERLASIVERLDRLERLGLSGVDGPAVDGPAVDPPVSASAIDWYVEDAKWGGVLGKVLGEMLGDRGYTFAAVAQVLREHCAGVDAGADAAASSSPESVPERVAKKQQQRSREKEQFDVWAERACLSADQLSLARSAWQAAWWVEHDHRVGLAVTPKMRDHRFRGCVGILRGIDGNMARIEMVWVNDRRVYGSGDGLILTEPVDDWITA